MLDFPCNIFQTPGCIGAIAYRTESKCAVVIGDPLCPKDEISKLSEAFHSYCLKSGLNIIYITVSENFAKWAKNYCKISMEVCEEFIFDPEIDICKVNSRVRRKINTATKHGLTIHEYIPNPIDKELEKSFLQIAKKWQESIKGPNVYLGHLNFFVNYTGRRWFYVKDGEKVTSMLMLTRMEISNGWLLKYMVTSPDAIQSTSEFLVTSLFKILKSENCRFLTKGPMPIDLLGEIRGFSSFMVWFIAFIYKIINWFYKLKKRKLYWFRYQPKLSPIYLLFYRPHIGINEIRALRKSFRTGDPQ
ncbi:MAG: DUF2156 domain-containing protein [Oligoflexia bacterium]|nr:DUF2156 domain-containing protein [Oligoflexia bacterium]